jgi:hypothetical protein
MGKAVVGISRPSCRESGSLLAVRSGVTHPPDSEGFNIYRKYRKKGASLMRFHKKVAVSLLLGFFVTTAAVSDLPAQDIKSGVVNSRDQILNPTTTKQPPTDPPADAGQPEPLPCEPKQNPKCPESPSRPPDVKGKS